MKKASCLFLFFGALSTVADAQFSNYSVVGEIEAQAESTSLGVTATGNNDLVADGYFLETLAAIAEGRDTSSFGTGMFTGSVVGQIANYGEFPGHSEYAGGELSVEFSITAGYYYFHEDYSVSPSAAFGSLGYGESPDALLFAPTGQISPSALALGPDPYISHESTFSSTVDWSGYLTGGTVYILYGAWAGDANTGGTVASEGYSRSDVYFSTQPVPAPCAAVVPTVWAATRRRRRIGRRR